MASIRDTIGLNKTLGDYGVEIEIEATDPVDWCELEEKDFGGWRVDEDGSLKKNGLEFILRKPVTYLSVPTALEELHNCLIEEDIEIDPSIRAGVHIHMNVQEFTEEDLCKFLSVYYPLETVLTKYCGNGRENNLFCLRARDAEGVCFYLDSYAENRNIFSLRTDSLRYSALNLQSLFLYGSIEFRALNTPTDVRDIWEWVKIIETLKKSALAQPTPWHSMMQISGEGGDTFLSQMLGEEFAKKLYYPGAEVDIMRDSRNIQSFLYGLKYSETKF